MFKFFLPSFDLGQISQINHAVNESFPLILASSSPRRRELLHRLGLQFVVIPSHIQEEDVPGTPEEKASTWARLKAQAIADQHSGIILGADTIVVLEGKVLGKPQDGKEAKRMLSQLSGRQHRVITGFALIHTQSGRCISESVESRVYFRTLTDEEIDAYVASGEPMDKAGAYGIQGKGASFITQVDGCCTNVMGLPVSHVLKFLKWII